MKKNPSAVQSDIYISWFILVMFFLYQYVLRSSPGVLIAELRHEFNMNADEFALMGATYYYGYSLMQIPLGIFIDRFGLRYTVFVSITMCIAGTYLLAITNNQLLAYVSRFIVGIGSASAFMSSLKLAKDYLPSSMQGIAIGATLTFGAIGALMGGKPLNYLLDQFHNWQTAFIIFSASGIFILFFAFLYIPTVKEYKNLNNVVDKVDNLLQELLTILNNKKILIYSLLAIGLYTPLLVMADLWGTAFLGKKLNTSREIASPLLMNIYIGMALGSIILPLFIKRINIHRMIQFSMLALLCMFSLLVYVDNLSYDLVVVLLIVMGFFCGAEMLCFTAALRHVDSRVSGLTIGVVNTLNMFSGAVMQQMIGAYLDINWHGALDKQGLRVYSTQEFVEAFSILVAIIAICAIISFIALNNREDDKK
jgi:MFS family permease